MLGVDPIVGLNSSILLSEDLWLFLEDVHLHTLKNAFFENQADPRLSCWITLEALNLGGRWKVEWDEYIDGLSHGGISLYDSFDSLCWMHNRKTGVVLVALSYDLIVSAHAALSSSKNLLMISKLAIPLKVKCFMWFLLKNRIDSWDTLRRKGWSRPSHWCLCLITEETDNHVFLACSFVKILLHQLKCSHNIEIC